MIGKIIFIGCLAFLIGAPVVSYYSGYRPPSCCIDETAIVWNRIQFTGHFAFGGGTFWNLYYTITSTNPRMSQFIGTNGTYTIKCDLYPIGTIIHLNRNVQPHDNADPFGVVENGTDFATLDNEPSIC